jgi:hypothetical protein
MDLPSLAAVTEYQVEFPPLHVLARGLAGYTPSAQPPSVTLEAPPEADAALVAETPHAPFSGQHAASVAAVMAAFAKGPPDG